MAVNGGKLSTRKSDSNPVAAELRRLDEANRLEKDWRRWGPYLPERQWATVREDYSPYGTCWEYFPHDHARSRAYRWGEDGLPSARNSRLKSSARPADSHPKIDWDIVRPPIVVAPCLYRLSADA